MRAYTINGMRFGAAPILAMSQAQMTAAQVLAQGKKQEANIPGLSLITPGYTPADIALPTGTAATNYTPWIIGGIAALVLGIGAWLFLRKKR